jgi:hypothetical protein
MMPLAKRPILVGIDVEADAVRILVPEAVLLQYFAELGFDPLDVLCDAAQKIAIRIEDGRDGYEARLAVHALSEALKASVEPKLTRCGPSFNGLLQRLDPYGDVLIGDLHVLIMLRAADMSHRFALEFQSAEPSTIGPSHRQRIVRPVGYWTPSGVYARPSGSERRWLPA